jgi:predicted RNA binding protein YcfA (HicA-like mRNA interferase family)
VPQKIRNLKSILRKAGVLKISQEGSHTKWQHPLVPTTMLILSGHDGDDAKPYQEKMVRDLLQKIETAKRRLK